MTVTSQDLAMLAPGTPLREAVDAVASARLGALLALGDEEAVDALSAGGFRLGVPFSPEALYELCKMDGAVTLDEGCTRIRAANVHLTPDPAPPSAETGIRHRTAEQLSLATRALVIAVSRRREAVSLYRGGHRVVLPSQR